MLRLDRLKAFLAFAETASFTEAARRLHLSQPALHAQVGHLSEELGVPLYRREGRGVVLTREGLELAAFARELDLRTERFLDGLHGRASARPVVLHAGEASTRYLLLPLLQPLLAEGHRIQLRVGSADATIAALHAGGADVGFTVPGALPVSLRAETVAVVPTVAVLPAGHALANRTRLSAAELAGEALVVPPPDRPHRQRIEQALAGVPWTVGAEVQGWELAVALSASHLGIALVNAFVPLPAGAIRLPFDDLPPVRYAIVRRRHAPSSPSLDAITTAMRTLEDRWSD